MNPARIAREAAAGDADRVMDAAGAAHGGGEGRGNRRADRPRSTGTSVILKRAASFARGAAQRLRERVIDVTEHKIRQRLWRDADTNAFLDSTLLGDSKRDGDAVRGRRRAAESKRGPSDADPIMTSMRDLASERPTSATRRCVVRRPSSNDCAPRSPRGASATRRARSATSRSRNCEGEVEPLYTPLDVRSPNGAPDESLPGAYPVHARHPPHGLSRQAVDDAAVRRLRQRARHERALQVPARARTDGTLDGVRFPDADGLRLRPSALGGRGREDAASRSRASPTWRRCSTAFRSTRSRRR